MDIDFIILLFSFMFVSAFILYQPWIGVVVYYAIALVSPSDFLPEFFSAFRLSLLIAVVTILSCAVSFVRNGVVTNNFRILFPYSLLAICALINLSHFFSEIDSQSVYFGIHTPNELVALFNKGILFFVISLFCITKWSQVECLLFMLFGVVVFFAIWVNIQYVTTYMNETLSTFRIGGPAGGNVEDENGMATLLVAGVAPAFYFVVNHKNNLFRIFSLIALVAILHAIFLTGSRGGLIGLLAVVLFIAMRFKFRKHGLLFVALIGLMIPLFGTTVMERLGTTIDKHSRSVEYIDPRISSWTMAVEILKSNPLLGIGPGRFQTEVTRYPLRENSPVGSCGNTPCVVHNTFLQISTSGGIFAGALYLLMLIYILIPQLFSRFTMAIRLLGGLLLQSRVQGRNGIFVRRDRTERFNAFLAMDKSDFRYYSGDVIRASMLGVYVCAVLLDLMLFDAFYLLAMLFVVRTVLVKREAAILKQGKKKRKKKRRSGNKWGYSPAAA